LAPRLTRLPSTPRARTRAFFSGELRARFAGRRKRRDDLSQPAQPSFRPRRGAALAAARRKTARDAELASSRARESPPGSRSSSSGAREGAPDRRDVLRIGTAAAAEHAEPVSLLQCNEARREVGRVAAIEARRLGELGVA